MRVGEKGRVHVAIACTSPMMNVKGVACSCKSQLNHLRLFHVNQPHEACAVPYRLIYMTSPSLNTSRRHSRRSHIVTYVSTVFSYSVIFSM